MTKDMTMFRRGGDFEFLWDRSQWPSGLGGFTRFYFDRSASVMTNAKLNSPKIQAQVQQKFGAILRLISKAYFGKKLKSSEARHALDSLILDENNSLGTYEAKIRNGNSFLDDFILRLDEFETRLNTPSVLCESFVNEVRNGSLKNYIGSKLGLLLEAGGSGVRPTNSVVRPCIRPSKRW
jgi:hypothetical protein